MKPITVTHWQGQEATVVLAKLPIESGKATRLRQSRSTLGSGVVSRYTVSVGGKVVCWIECTRSASHKICKGMNVRYDTGYSTDWTAYRIETDEDPETLGRFGGQRSNEIAHAYTRRDLLERLLRDGHLDTNTEGRP